MYLGPLIHALNYYNMPIISYFARKSIPNGQKMVKKFEFSRKIGPGCGPGYWAERGWSRPGPVPGVVPEGDRIRDGTGRDGTGRDGTGPGCTLRVFSRDKVPVRGPVP